MLILWLWMAAALLARWFGTLLRRIVGCAPGALHEVFQLFSRPIRLQPLPVQQSCSGRDTRDVYRSVDGQARTQST